MPAMFMKKPIPVQAAQNMEEDYYIKTLEGELICRVGDWCITGVDGEQWPVKDSIFRKTYAPANDEAREAWVGV